MLILNRTLQFKNWKKTAIHHMASWLHPGKLSNGRDSHLASLQLGLDSGPRRSVDSPRQRSKHIQYFHPMSWFLSYRNSLLIFSAVYCKDFGFLKSSACFCFQFYECRNKGGFEHTQVTTILDPSGPGAPFCKRHMANLHRSPQKSHGYLIIQNQAPTSWASGSYLRISKSYLVTARN